MTIIIDGKARAAALQADIARQTGELQRQHQLTPGLAVVLANDNPASEVYVRRKGEMARAVGFHSVEHRLSTQVGEDDLLALVAELNHDPAIHGILVQLPLPAHIHAERVLEAIDPAKDVDGFHPMNVGRVQLGMPGLVPCTPLGCMLLLREQLADLSGLDAVVVGRSNIVGKPMAALLLAAHCTVTIAHSRTRDLAAVCRRADILVAAVGKPQFIPGDWVKPGATVIDVGINRIPSDTGKTRLVGDMDFASAAAVAGAITPVPKGVGPMTIACLLRNTLQAACASHGLPGPD